MDLDWISGGWKLDCHLFELVVDDTPGFGVNAE